MAAKRAAFSAACRGVKESDHAAIASGELMSPPRRGRRKRGGGSSSDAGPSTVQPEVPSDDKQIEVMAVPKTEEDGKQLCN